MSHISSCALQSVNKAQFKSHKRNYIRLCLCLSKHHVMKTQMAVEVDFTALSNSPLEGLVNLHVACCSMWQVLFVSFRTVVIRTKKMHFFS